MMKKLIKLCVFLLCVVVMLATSKVVSKANETKDNEKESVVVTNKENSETTEDKVEEAFTFRLYVDKLDLYTYNKGHNGKHTIEYSINGGEIYKADMSLDVVAYLQTQPLYVAHYVDIKNVKEGDVVDYTYSYYNTYLFPEDEEPSRAKGSKVVKK